MDKLRHITTLQAAVGLPQANLPLHPGNYGAPFENDTNISEIYIGPPIYIIYPTSETDIGRRI